MSDLISPAPPTEENAIARESYFFVPEEMDAIENDLVAKLRRESQAEDDIVAVLVPWDSHYSPFGRTSETQAYGGYDNYVAMLPYEHHSFFIYTIDLDQGKIAHVKRIVEPKTLEEAEETGLTGIEIIDDRLTAKVPSEAASLQDILAYHEITDINQAWNVTSNHTTERFAYEDARQYFSKPHSLVSYKATFELGRQAPIDRLFAYLNPAAIKSLGRLGLTYQDVAGGDFHLPEPRPMDDEHLYDEHYKAVCIPYSEHNMSAFTTVNPEFRATQYIADRVVPIYRVAADDSGLELVSRN